MRTRNERPPVDHGFTPTAAPGSDLLPPRPDPDPIPGAPTRPTGRRGWSTTDRAIALGAILLALVMIVVLVPVVLRGRGGTPNRQAVPSTAFNHGLNPNAPHVFHTASSRPPVAPSGGPDAVSYQGDAAHDGDARDASVQLPLSSAWSRTWNGVVSYPLIADGRVFVAVDQSENQLPGTPGKAVYAIDASTGKTLWTQAVSGIFKFLGIAYDAGRLFVVNTDGLFVAYDATSGATVWSAKVSAEFNSPPTVWGGQLYAGGSGILYAVDEATGDVRWTQAIENGDHSIPVLFGTKVAVGYACFQIRAFDTWRGTMAWNHSTGCEGGGGRTMAYHDGRLYARDDASRGGVILDASTGRDTGKFVSTTIPAFDGSTGYFLEEGTLRARDLTTMQVRWSFAGDGSLVSAPLVVGGHVFVAATSGLLYELGPDGHLIDSVQLGAAVTAPDEHNAMILTGMNAGDGILAVAASGRLVAFR